MRPIISGIESIIYSLARYLADLLKLLVRKTKRHMQNPKGLMEKWEEIEIEVGEVITSFNVTALFTSVPDKAMVQMAIQRVKCDPGKREPS